MLFLSRVCRNPILAPGLEAEIWEPHKGGYGWLGLWLGRITSRTLLPRKAPDDRLDLAASWFVKQCTYARKVKLVWAIAAM